MSSNKSQHVFSNLRRREAGGVSQYQIFEALRGSKDVIKRLGRWRVLNGHEGCVNTIWWNENGDKILSGSDDCKLNVFHVAKNELLHSIRSGHRANIFSAKFLPCSQDLKIVSCCGSGMVHYNEIGVETLYGHNYFNCHAGTTYEVATLPGDPNSFMTCGEDGTVRHFDLRLKSNCYCQECREDILIEVKPAITSLCVNPMNPCSMAVGCDDSIVRVYDIRALGEAKERGFYRKSQKASPGLLCSFKPPQLKGASCRVTSLHYSNNGDEILVSYSTDYVYLFSLKDAFNRIEARHLEKENLECGPEEGGDNEEKSDLPSIKRLRLRGDWSDTGPNAMPESDRDAEESERGEDASGTFMQRIYGVFSQSLEEAFNLAHSSAANEEEEVEINLEEDEAEDSRRQEESHCEDTNEGQVEDQAFQHVSQSQDQYLGQDENQNEGQSLEQIADQDVVDEAGSMNENIEKELDLNIERNMDQNMGQNIKRNVDPSIERNLDRNGNQNMSNNVDTNIEGNMDGNVNQSIEKNINQNEEQIVDQNLDLNTERSVNQQEDRNIKCEVGQSKKQSVVENRNKFDGHIDNSKEGDLSLVGDEFYSKDQNMNLFKVETTDLVHGKPSQQTLRAERKEESQNMDQSHDGVDEDCEGDLKKKSDINETFALKMARDITKQSIATVDNCACKVADTGPYRKTLSNEFSSRLGSNDASDGCSEFNAVNDKSADVGSGSSDQPIIIHGQRKIDETSRKIPAERNKGIFVHSGLNAHTDTTAMNKGIESTTCCSSNENRSRHVICEQRDSNYYDSSESDLLSGNCSKIPGNSMTGNQGIKRSSERIVDESGTVMSNTADSGHECNNRRSASDDPVPSHSELDTELPEATSALQAENKQSEDDYSSVSSGASTTRRARSSSNRTAAATRIQRYFRSRKSFPEPSIDESKVFVKLEPKMCFRGHRNARTTIKEANFWGDNFVLSGSDCGRIFIWDKHTGILVSLLEGDKHVVNCVQPHPFDPVLATSGIDYDIKVWAPILQQPAILQNAEEIIRRNERMLEENRGMITIPASFMLRMLASINRVRGLRRRQQDQDEDGDEDGDEVGDDENVSNDGD